MALKAARAPTDHLDSLDLPERAVLLVHPATLERTRCRELREQLARRDHLGRLETAVCPDSLDLPEVPEKTLTTARAQDALAEHVLARRRELLLNLLQNRQNKNLCTCVVV